MGFFTNLKSALESKRNSLGKVNTFLTNSDWSQTQRKLDNLETEASKVFVYNPEVIEQETACKSEVDNYKAEVISIKADCTKDMSEAVTMVNYSKCNSANDFKDICNTAVEKAEKTVEKARSSMEKANSNALKAIADKLKGLASVGKKKGIDLTEVYDKKKEYEKMHSNIIRMEEETRQRANKEGHLKVRNEIISNLSSMKKDVKTVKESQEFDEYLKKIPLDVLASINKKLHEAEIGYMLESDGKGKNATVTEQQLERQRQKVQALKTEVDDKIAASKQALEIQREGIKKFDDIRKNPDILNAYSIVDMQRLGLIASQSVARQNCIVMMSSEMDKRAIENGGKGNYPAVIVVDHDGTVHAYDTFAKCDEAKHLGVSDPNKARTLQIEGNLQNTTEYSLNGQMEAYVNYVRDIIKDKDREQALQHEYERAVHGGPNVVGVSQQYLDYQRMAKERESAEALSNFMFDSNWDFIKDASSKVQAQMAPVIINIKREMEAREAYDKDQLLTGTVLRDKTQLVQGEHGQEFAPVLVLSASMTALDKAGESIHPTINVVCNENGQFQSAYYSEEYHDTSCAYLGQKIADTEHGIDYSLYSNNPTVRNFLEAYPSIKQTIEQNCELSKFYDDRNITLEDVMKAQEEVELEQE